MNTNVAPIQCVNVNGFRNQTMEMSKERNFRMVTTNVTVKDSKLAVNRYTKLMHIHLKINRKRWKYSTDIEAAFNKSVYLNTFIRWISSYQINASLDKDHITRNRARLLQKKTHTVRGMWQQGKPTCAGHSIPVYQPDNYAKMQELICKYLYPWIQKMVMKRHAAISSFVDKNQIVFNIYISIMIQRLLVDYMNPECHWARNGTKKNYWNGSCFYTIWYHFGFFPNVNLQLWT